MHEYVATTVQRHHVVRNLTLLSVALSFALGVVFHWLKVPTPIAPPAGAVAFGAIFLAYNHLLWRWGWGRLRFSAIPDLRGTWAGEIDIRQGSAGAADATAHRCTVKIEQTWLKISIEFETSESSSNSVMAKIGERAEGGLRYEYVVHPDPDARLERNSSERPKDHSGTAHLRPQDDTWTSLKGGYYNDEGFHRWGAYWLAKLPEP